MLFVLLALHPGIFLAIGDDFEGEAADIKEGAYDVGDADCGGKGGEDGGGERVNGEYGHEAEGHPGGLSEEGTEEFGGRGADVVEAGVGAVGTDAAVEVGAHWVRFVSLCNQRLVILKWSIYVSIELDE